MRKVTNLLSHLVEDFQWSGDGLGGKSLAAICMFTIFDFDDSFMCVCIWQKLLNRTLKNAHYKPTLQTVSPSSYVTCLRQHRTYRKQLQINYS